MMDSYAMHLVTIAVCSMFSYVLNVSFLFTAFFLYPKRLARLRRSRPAATLRPPVAYTTRTYQSPSPSCFTRNTLRFWPASVKRRAAKNCRARDTAGSPRWRCSSAPGAPARIYGNPQSSVSDTLACWLARANMRSSLVQSAS